MRALLRASLRRRDELVKSCNRLESTSKLMTNARSLGRRISLRKLAPTCFSISRTRCWLPLESIRMPRVRGRSDSAVKYLMVSRFAVFEELKIVLGQAGNQPAFLVLDVEKELDDVDVDLQRADRLVALLGLVFLGLTVRIRECRPDAEAVWARSQTGREKAGGQRTGQQGGHQNGACKRLKPADYRHPDILPHFLLVYSIRVRCTKLQVPASEILAVARQAERFPCS